MTWLPRQTTGPATFRSTRRIGDEFSVYLTIDETGEDELEISDHPVQEGAEVTDNAYKKNATLNLTIQFSEAETFVPLDETYRRMLELQESRIPFEVVTARRLYTNMLFKTLRSTTDKNTDNVLAIQATLREIKIVQVTTTTVPPRAKQKNPGKTGATQRAGNKKAKEVKPQDQPKKKSALKKISGT